MNSNSKHWLYRLSSKWALPVDKEALAALKARPEVEAFKAWLALQAFPLVVAQARVQSRKPKVDPNGQVIESTVTLMDDQEYRINAARLELLATIFLELETTSRSGQVIDTE